MSASLWGSVLTLIFPSRIGLIHVMQLFLSFCHLSKNILLFLLKWKSCFPGREDDENLKFFFSSYEDVGLSMIGQIEVGE